MGNNSGNQHYQAKAEGNFIPPLLQFKIPDSNVTFCKYLVIAATIIIACCCLHTLVNMAGHFFLWTLVVCIFF